MAVKIRLKRLGKIRVPQYRIVVVDSRKKRDGRVIEEIGKYHPKEDPSYIDVVSDRAQYWLGVGAQPTEAVEEILKITGDWQKFKGLPGTEGTLKVEEPKRDKLEIFNEALKDAAKEPKGEAVTRRPAKKAAPAAPRPKAATEAEAEASRPRLRRRGRDRGPAEAPAEAAGRGAGRRGAPAPVPADETPEGAAEAAEIAAETADGEQGLSMMLAEALEHLVRGVVDNPDDVVGPRQAAASRVGPRGAGAPRRPRQGDRPQRPHRDGVPHRHLGPRGPRWRAHRLRRRRPPPLTSSSV